MPSSSSSASASASSSDSASASASSASASFSSAASRRSASVRVQSSSSSSHGLLRSPPPFQRSSSVSVTTIRIGSTGSISSLIGGDLPEDPPSSSSPQHRPKLRSSSTRHAHETPPLRKLPSSHRNPDPPAPALLPAVPENAHKKVPRWKKLLNRLIGGGRLLRRRQDRVDGPKKAGNAEHGHGDGGKTQKKTEESIGTNGDGGRKVIRSGKEEDGAVGNTVADPHPHHDDDHHHHQRSSSTEYRSNPNPNPNPNPELSMAQQTSPIYERRNFSGIEPLDLSSSAARSKQKKQAHAQ